MILLFLLVAFSPFIWDVLMLRVFGLPLRKQVVFALAKSFGIYSVLFIPILFTASIEVSDPLRQLFIFLIVTVLFFVTRFFGYWFFARKHSELMTHIFASLLATLPFFFLLHKDFERLLADPPMERTLSAVQSTCQILKIFLSHNGRLPTNSEAFIVLLEKPEHLPRWRGPYLSEIPKDGYAHELRYQNNGDPELSSAGPDGAFYTTDDITIVCENY